MDDHNTWRIAVQTKPSLVRAARLFAASVVRQHDIIEPIVEDVKLAVAEAINLAIASGAPSVEVVLTAIDGAVTIAVAPAGGPTGDPVDGFEVISALFPDAVRTDDEISFSIPGGD